MLDSHPPLAWARSAITERRLQVRLGGELDIAAEPELLQLFSETLASLDGQAQAVLDLTAVTFADAAGYRLIRHFVTRLRKKGHEVEVIPSPQVRRLLSIIGDADLLPDDPL